MSIFKSISGLFAMVAIASVVACAAGPADEAGESEPAASDSEAVTTGGGATGGGVTLCAPSKCPKVAPAITRICPGGGPAELICVKKNKACGWDFACGL